MASRTYSNVVAKRGYQPQTPESQDENTVMEQNSSETREQDKDKVIALLKEQNEVLTARLQELSTKMDQWVKLVPTQPNRPVTRSLAAETQKDQPSDNDGNSQEGSGNEATQEQNSNPNGIQANDASDDDGDNGDDRDYHDNQG